MKIPLVAIVGRPNVGKSRLFNRLTRSRRAIVDQTPGVTRDRNYAQAEWSDRVFNLVDTGGFDPDEREPLMVKMREQAQMAIDEADVVLVLFDSRDGLLPADWEITDLLRRSRKPTVYAVNKVDGPRHDPLVVDFHELGVDPLFAISAEHGRGIEELMDHLAEPFPLLAELEAEREARQEGETHIAVVGRPNVGKSTLVNRLIGEERLLTSEIPGTTRDSIDTLIERGDHRYLLIDTAGVRRRKAVVSLPEQYSVVGVFGSIDRADVVLYLIDALVGPTDQDARLMNLVMEKGRALGILFNKWDLVEKDGRTADQYTRAFRELLPTISWAPVTYISARTGQRVQPLLERARQLREAWAQRIPTAELNRFLATAVERFQPPVHRNRRIKLYYMSQLKACPPLFAVVANYPEAIPAHYQRYLLKQLREAYPFEGVPIKVTYRKRSRKEERET
ncbi:MAG: ribosome biogenesis GTPase Der [Bradymonadales bacterium]|nr:ribosome biogenesis GTPase Der [Bradymonadales bacterium]